MATPELAKEYPLILISGSRVRAYHHSSHRQIANLRKRYPEPLLQISPQTAARLGIAEGDKVCIETPLGKITQKAQLLEGMAPSVVHADGYWWYPEKPEAEPSLFGVWESNIDSILPDAPRSVITWATTTSGGCCAGSTRRHRVRKPVLPRAERFDRWAMEGSNDFEM